MVVALLHCPPLLALACSCLSYARDALYGPSSSSCPDHGLEPLSAAGLGLGFEGRGGGGGGGWASEVCEAEEAFGGGGRGVLGVYADGGGRQMVCVEVDW